MVYDIDEHLRSFGPFSVAYNGHSNSWSAGMHNKEEIYVFGLDSEMEAKESLLGYVEMVLLDCCQTIEESQVV